MKRVERVNRSLSLRYAFNRMRCSPRELVAFQTYPLRTTWPLVITSLMRSYIICIALRGTRGTVGRRTTGIGCSPQHSVGCTCRVACSTRQNLGALCLCGIQPECTCTYARPEARVAATSTRENTGNSTAVRQKRGGSSFTSSLSQVKSG